MQSRLILLVFMLLIIDIRGQICWIDGCDVCDGKSAICNTNQTENIVPEAINNSTQFINITYDGPATMLRNSMLKRFQNLTKFHIHGNIDKIEYSTFVGSSLDTVDITETLVEHLPDKAFGENSILKYLYLGYTHLNSIPINTFKHLPNLKSLDLAYAPIKRVCSMVNIGAEFRVLKHLEELDLSGLARFEDCSNVSEHYLEPLSHMTGKLILTDTGFFHGSQKILKPLKNIGELVINNLSPYKECPNQARELLENLPSGLRVIEIQNWQTTSPLNVSCQITYTTLEGLRSLPDLEDLNFAFSSGIFGNTLTVSLLQGLQALRQLDLRWCQLSKIESGALDHLQLSDLLLRGNQLGSRELRIFNINKTLSYHLRDLDLSYAQLSLDESSFIYHADHILTSFPSIYYLGLSDNNMYNVPRFFSQGENQNRCSLEFLDLSTNNLDSLDSNEMRDICVRCSGLYGLNVRDNRIASVLGIVACTQLRSLDLNNNLLIYGNQTKTFAVLQQFSELTYLDLGSNALTYIHAALFTDMEHLDTLYLQDNQIASMDAVNFEVNPLTRLYLSSNQLTSFSINIIKTNRMMNELRLDKNHIREFPSLFMDFVEKNLTSLYNISARGNPFDCSCGKLQFQSWVRNSTKLVDGKDLVCETPETLLGHRVYKYKESYFDCQLKLPLIIICTIVGGVILIALVSTRCYRYRWYMSHIRVVLRAVAVAATSAKTMNECKYDVMICVDKSSNSDVDWVITKLLPELEGGEYSTVDTEIRDDRKNRVYLHMRDAVPGGYRVEILCEAMKQSRKIIIILSNSFLENTECMSEAVFAREELYSTRTYKPGRVMAIILEELREDLLLGSPVSGLLTETVIDLPERLRTDSNTHRMNRIWKRIHKFVDKEKWIVYQKSSEQRSQRDGYESL